MKKQTIAIAAGVILGLILVSSGGVYAFEKWRMSQPTKENFDKVVRIIWEKNNGLKGGNAFGDTASPLCVSVPSFPAPAARSKAQQPLAWHIDFLLDPSPTKDREKQLRQLDALSNVGLLAKSKTIANFTNEAKEVTRYSLTEKGWSASGYLRSETCFAFGKQQYLGISRFEPKIVGNQTGLEIYEVRAKTGLSSETDLAPWARDSEVQAEFPEIKRSLDGQEFAVLLVRGTSEWVDYQTVLQDEVLKKNTKLVNQTESMHSHISIETQRKIAELNALPAPNIDEVKKLLQKAHGVAQKDPWPIPCLNLPGSEKMPVDKPLFTYTPPHYSVAIFKDRTAYDRVAIKTIPYLHTLVQLGILSKRTKSGVLGEGKEAGTRSDVYIFELSPIYKNQIHSSYPYCFPLGEPSVEFVDIQVAEKDVNGYPYSSFRYKLKVMYKNPPTWMNDTLLLNGWSELRGAIERGMACEGEFGFDRKTRDKHSGSGSCWWGFDSYYENY